ncbi:uncharacterized protein METZ01_LOCUS106137 [marine metagenome]|uniref:Uncharacterized protein n=1 Tax=marine metagenome TaxID=408172 RepID=A0A381WN26_9ZZZZ
MKKQLKFWTIHSVIVLPILVFALTIPQPSLSKSPLPIYKVWEPCEAYKNSEDEDKKEIAGIVCHLYINTMYESYYYHWSFTEHYKDEGDSHLVAMAEIYSPYGCDIKGLYTADFIDLFISYVSKHPDEMEDSFFHTIRNITRPYCAELKKANNPEFFLDEEDGRRKS